MDYDDQSESSDSRPESRHRPQSRASQHSQESGNGYASQGHGNHHRRQQQRGYDPQQPNLYQYQQSQFDEPRRAEDDDMW